MKTLATFGEVNIEMWIEKQPHQTDSTGHTNMQKLPTKWSLKYKYKEN